jgi:chemotaxis protein CheX
LDSVSINSFLQSSLLVFEQFCQIRPQIGKPAVRQVELADGPYWLKISILGDMRGEVYYSFPRNVALKIVSVMMGGMRISELDEIGLSALAEIGNMICGNASTLLYGQGYAIDISPPAMVTPGTGSGDKAILVPLVLDGVGEVELYVNLRAAS